MTTLRDFIKENTLTKEQLDKIRQNSETFATAGMKIPDGGVSGPDQPHPFAKTISDRLTTYYHNQSILRFLKKRCADTLDEEITEEDVRLLASVGANIYELRYFYE